MPHIELNLAPTAEDMPDMAIALIRAIIAAADKDRDEMTRRRRLKHASCSPTRGAEASA